GDRGAAALEDGRLVGRRRGDVEHQVRHLQAGHAGGRVRDRERQRVAPGRQPGDVHAERERPGGGPVDGHGRGRGHRAAVDRDGGQVVVGADQPGQGGRREVGAGGDVERRFVHVAPGREGRARRRGNVAGVTAGVIGDGAAARR